mmetsp:Transcript_37267/g.57222  ORF Transcript_37267/g.57222 Transcript_37267/m.57222 type:complete len:212 (-) Transcript_37267:347-982(-)
MNCMHVLSCKSMYAYLFLSNGLGSWLRWFCRSRFFWFLLLVLDHESKWFQHKLKNWGDYISCGLYSRGDDTNHSTNNWVDKNGIESNKLGLNEVLVNGFQIRSNNSYNLGCHTFGNSKEWLHNENSLSKGPYSLCSFIDVLAHIKRNLGTCFWSGRSNFFLRHFWGYNRSCSNRWFDNSGGHLVCDFEIFFFWNCVVGKVHVVVINSNVVW